MSKLNGKGETPMAYKVSEDDIAQNKNSGQRKPEKNNR